MRQRHCHVEKPLCDIRGWGERDEKRASPQRQIDALGVKGGASPATCSVGRPHARHVNTPSSLLWEVFPDCLQRISVTIGLEGQTAGLGGSGRRMLFTGSAVVTRLDLTTTAPFYGLRYLDVQHGLSAHVLQGNLPGASVDLIIVIIIVVGIVRLRDCTIQRGQTDPRSFHCTCYSCKRCPCQQCLCPMRRLDNQTLHIPWALFSVNELPPLLPRFKKRSGYSGSIVCQGSGN